MDTISTTGTMPINNTATAAAAAATADQEQPLEMSLSLSVRVGVLCLRHNTLSQRAMEKLQVPYLSLPSASVTASATATATVTACISYHCLLPLLLRRCSFFLSCSCYDPTAQHCDRLHCDHFMCPSICFLFAVSCLLCLSPALRGENLPLCPAQALLRTEIPPH